MLFESLYTKDSYIRWKNPLGNLHQVDVITSDTIYWMSNAARATTYLCGFTINKIC
jgi:hypothetical protein